MIISFFSQSYYQLGVDCSDNAECIFQTEIADFNSETHIPILEGEAGNYSVRLEEKTPEALSETPSQKFDRVYNALLALENIDENTDHAILEGLEFSDKQIGDLIVARVFPDEKTGEPNPHGQTALLAKIMADPSYATNPDAVVKSQAINNIRLFFGLSRLTPEEQAERRAMRGG